MPAAKPCNPPSMAYDSLRGDPSVPRTGHSSHSRDEGQQCGSRTHTPRPRGRWPTLMRRRSPRLTSESQLDPMFFALDLAGLDEAVAEIKVARPVLSGNVTRHEPRGTGEATHVLHGEVERPTSVTAACWSAAIMNRHRKYTSDSGSMSSITKPTVSRRRRQRGTRLLAGSTPARSRRHSWRHMHATRAQRRGCRSPARSQL